MDKTLYSSISKWQTIDALCSDGHLPGEAKVTPHKVERIAAHPATRDVTQSIRAQREKLQTNI
jgi:hypothetical protein